MTQIVVNASLPFTHFWSVVITTLRRRDYPQMLHISLNTLLILLKGVIMSQDVMYVVDFGDDFVLYYGTMRDCEQVVDESYGGLLITSYHNLTVAMKAQVGIDSA